MVTRAMHTLSFVTAGLLASTLLPLAQGEERPAAISRQLKAAAARRTASRHARHRAACTQHVPRTVLLSDDDRSPS
jgi:hypothetical protein